MSDIDPKEGELMDVLHSRAQGGSSGLHRRLGPRQIQLVAIGGSIGTALFIAIGSALYKGGPASLLIAFIIECTMVGFLNNCLAEMTTYMPVNGGFISLAGKWVDDAFGFMAGWNFFIYMALTVLFEISAVNLLLSFWRDDIPVLAVCLVCIAVYTLINLFAVGTYGEAEFWLSGGEVLLIFILFFFTSITMVGGNPQHDAYGFRYWKDPGPFANLYDNGSLGRFEGFLGALWIAIFTCVGPEYISMVAAEAKHPRIYIKSAFKTVYWRFGVFFIGGAICVGIIIAHNDTGLVEAITSGESSAAASPYILAMKNLGIKGLPDLCSALMLTSVFSAGNTYTYAATRALHGLAINGRAPKFLAYTTKKGIPLYCFAVVIAFSFLSLLQLSGGSYQVLNWLISITTANILIDYIIIMVTYVCFYRACKAQGFDRSSLPYLGQLQPYSAYIGLAWFVILVFCFGYKSFTPWDVSSFFLSYTMLIFNPLCFVFWKLFKKTGWLRPSEVDLKWEADAIAVYEEMEEEMPTTFWREILRLIDPRGLVHQVKGFNNTT
ncbi:unnamed protein product [Clonostachys rosea f. rosea IK726]|uniref:Amino acid permease/ SLC12A domain-containing protein n=2 Tax=Bionectria ochroleuca TaxID=29856 RepID=A0A0B7K1A0_BIOOC|nr:unnamed protein product [Clonostachys rosea f. rosea IK726]